MNALFRRDYLYEFKNGTPTGRLDNTLRYLKFDRKKKEYVFLEGSHKTSNELEFRVKESKGTLMYGRIKKLHRIGYENTDVYLREQAPKKVVKVAPRPTLEKPKVITDVNDMTIGKTYRIKMVRGYISDLPLKLESRNIGGNIIAEFRAERGFRQRLFKDSKFKAREVE